MWKVPITVSLLLVLLLQNHKVRSDGPAVALGLSAAQVTPHTDESVRTNQDTLPHDEEEIDAVNPIPLNEEQSFPEFMVIPEDAHHGGLSRESRQTQEVTSLNEDFLFFCNRQFLVMMNRDGTGVKAFRTGATTNNIACDFDFRNDYMFWSDVNNKYIFRAKFDGTGVTILAQTNITVPDGIAWDWVNHKLYWTDAEDRDIEVLDPATGSREVLITTGDPVQSKPRAIVLDPIVSRKMYWTDWGSSPRIERASLTGTSREILHNTSLYWPNALTIDLPTQTLYWADAGLDRIECSHADGSGRRLLIGQYLPHPFGIDFFNGTLYWTDWNYRAVLNTTIHHNATHIRYTIYSMINLLNHPMGIKVVSLSKQPIGVATPSPTCTPECQNGGTCASPGVCTCATGWRGNHCQDAICTRMCGHGSCTAPDTCSCSSGWTGQRCDEAICTRMCGHGSCTAPDTCSCSSGWTGQRCDEAICDPSCSNGGTCVAPGTCSCATGWEGDTCNIAMCGSLRCMHGTCDEKTKKCVCDSGWSGDTCEKGICRKGCKNGDCVRPEYCECHEGWSGSACSNAICNPRCVKGNCVGPNLCA